MLFLLLMSTLMLISSNHWIIVWLLLELNTLLMCFLFSLELVKNSISSLTVCYYYSIQVLSSLLILMYLFKGDSFFFSHMMLLLSVLMKMGVWPFHSWYLLMIKNLDVDFISLWMMLTWQKLAPLYLLVSTSMWGINLFFFFLLLMNLVVSLVMMKKVLNIKTILGFSSMNSNSWLMLMVYYSFMMWKLFLFFYSMSIIFIFIFLKMNKRGAVLGGFLLLFMMVLNVSGFPPLMMFWVKLASLKVLLFSYLNMIVVLFWLLAACYVIFYYINMMLLDYFFISFK